MKIRLHNTRTYLPLLPRCKYSNGFNFLIYRRLTFSRPSSLGDKRCVQGIASRTCISVFLVICRRFANVYQIRSWSLEEKSLLSSKTSIYCTSWNQFICMVRRAGWCISRRSLHESRPVKATTVFRALSTENRYLSGQRRLVPFTSVFWFSASPRTLAARLPSHIASHKPAVWNLPVGFAVQLVSAKIPP